MSTRAQILAEIAAQFPDNTTGLITPAKLRQVTEDLANSCAVPAAGTGAVAAADITDASASGIVALTSPAALAVAASAKVTLTATSAQVQSLTLTGAQDVELPAESGTWAFVILNTAASTGAATIKRAGGTTVATLAAGDSGLFVFDGVAVGAY